MPRFRLLPLVPLVLVFVGVLIIKFVLFPFEVFLVVEEVVIVVLKMRRDKASELIKVRRMGRMLIRRPVWPFPV
jgi:hypothetical protein